MKFEDVEVARERYNAKSKEISKKRHRIILITLAVLVPIEIIAPVFFVPKSFTHALTPPQIISVLVIFMIQVILLLFISSIFTWKDTTTQASYYTDYRHAYKAFFVRNQLAKFFTNIRYDHAKGLNRNLLQATGLIHTGDIYKSNDLVEAKYKNTNFIQADVEIVDKREETDSEGHHETYYETIFKGRYLIFEFPKKFDFKMVISHSGDVQDYVNPKTKRSLSRITTESPNFNKRFLVYAEDGFEAFYILNPSFIENLEKLDEKYQNRLALYFSDNKMYVGLNDNNDAFEPPRADTPIDQKAEEAKVNSSMLLITGLVDSLKLSK